METEDEQQAPSTLPLGLLLLLNAAVAAQQGRAAAKKAATAAASAGGDRDGGAGAATASAVDDPEWLLDVAAQLAKQVSWSFQCFIVCVSSSV
jgi:hypothetical protein